jgi:hypothetical protein
MTQKQTPFCPKCGKKENIKSLSEYLESWKCTDCSIRFDFSKLDPNIIYGDSLIRTQLDPSRKIVLGPSRKVVLGLSRKSVLGRYGKINIKGRSNRKGGNLGQVKT